MQLKDSAPDDKPDWKVIEEGLLDRVRGVARRIVERVRRVVQDADPPPPDEPANEAPGLA